MSISSAFPGIFWKPFRSFDFNPSKHHKYTKDPPTSTRLKFNQVKSLYRNVDLATELYSQMQKSTHTEKGFYKEERKMGRKRRGRDLIDRRPRSRALIPCERRKEILVN